MIKAFKSIPLEAFVERYLHQDNDQLPIDRAYEKVGWFRRACDVRAESVRSFPYDIIGNGGVLYTEDVLQEQDGSTELIMKPTDIDIFHMLDDMVLDLDQHGAFYAIYEINSTERNGKWRRLMPSTIKPVIDGEKGLTGFKRRVKGKEITYAVDDLLYLWMPCRTIELGPGVGIARSALWAATALSYIQQFQSKFFQNGALNPTIVGIPEYGELGDVEQQRIKSGFQKLMGGIRNAFKIIPVAGNVNIVNLMQNLTEMAMETLISTLREEISTTMGVPHSLLFSNAANYATAGQDDINFYDKTIVPFVVLIQQQLNERLFIPKGYVLNFNKGRLPVFKQAELDRLLALYDRGIVDADMVRDHAGYTMQETPDEQEPVEPDETDSEDSTEQQPKMITMPSSDDFVIREASSILGIPVDQTRQLYAAYSETLVS